MSQVTWIGTNFYEQHLFLEPGQKSELFIKIRYQGSNSSGDVIDSLEGKLLLSMHNKIPGKADIEIQKEFELVFVAEEASDLLLFKAEIPSDAILPGRYNLNASFLNIFTDKVFYLSDYQEVLPVITAGKSGIISSTVSYEVQGVNNAKTFGLICPEQTIELLPVLLEGVYTHGFCTDEIASLKDISVHLWLHKDIVNPQIFIIIRAEDGTNLLKKELELKKISEHGKPLSPYFPNTLAVNDPENIEDRLYGTSNLADHLLDLVDNQPGIHSIFFSFEMETESQTKDLLNYTIKTNFEIVDAPIGADCQAFLLPIELVDFEIYNQETQVFGFWVVALEVNCEYYEVEKSKDAWNWIPVQKEASKGVEGALRRYEFLDKAPWTGISYYRIKQVDFDGTRSYSKVLAAHIKSGKLRLFPNPITDRLQYSIEDTDQQYDIKIFNELGACVYSCVIPESNNKNSEIDLESLASGVYYIKYINTKNYLSQVEKFIKI